MLCQDKWVSDSDGTQTEVGPGEVVSIAPGHDSWTVGQSPCLWFDYEPEG